MWHFIGEMVLGSLVKKGVDYALPKVVDYAEKKYSEYQGNGDDEEIDVGELVFDIIEIFNEDTEILNNRNDTVVAGFVKNELEKRHSFYKNIDINVEFIENIIESIRFDVKIRYSLLKEFKKRPQIIRQKTSAITKTVCANIGIYDDNVKSEVSSQIYVIKKILELHNGGASKKEIFQQIRFFNKYPNAEETYYFSFAFEFEIMQFIRVFANL